MRTTREQDKRRTEKYKGQQWHISAYGSVFSIPQCGGWHAGSSRTNTTRSCYKKQSEGVGLLMPGLQDVRRWLHHPRCSFLLKQWVETETKYIIKDQRSIFIYLLPFCTHSQCKMFWKLQTLLRLEKQFLPLSPIQVYLFLFNRSDSQLGAANCFSRKANLRFQLQIKR